MVASEPHHWIRLNSEFQSDLQWWDLFLEDWNGISVFANLASTSSPATELTTDASESWGCGAFNSSGEWFQLQWPSAWRSIHITVKELVPIVVGCASVRCQCDNAAVVAIIKSGTCKDARATELHKD